MDSIGWFRFGRFIELIRDFFKNLFEELGCFFRKLFFNSRTERASVKIRRAKERVSDILAESNHNWNNRTFEDHGFRINEDDI